MQNICTQGSHLIDRRMKKFENVFLLLNSRTYRIVHASQYNVAFFLFFFIYDIVNVASKYNLARRVHEKEARVWQICKLSIRRPTSRSKMFIPIVTLSIDRDHGRAGRHLRLDAILMRLATIIPFVNNVKRKLCSRLRKPLVGSSEIAFFALRSTTVIYTVCKILRTNFSFPFFHSQIGMRLLSFTKISDDVAGEDIHGTYTYSRQTARLLDVHYDSNNRLKAYCDMTCYPVFNVQRTRRLLRDSRPLNEEPIVSV